ncbi:hypothetical protein, partial [Microcoleus sp. BROC3]|uniref:hypothetical protein n=1 Tax=Microcoleus sp. BROC3 TaxID=3055323 RepID=UPI002FD118DF
LCVFMSSGQNNTYFGIEDNSKLYVPEINTGKAYIKSSLKILIAPDRQKAIDYSASPIYLVQLHYKREIFFVGVFTLRWYVLSTIFRPTSREISR